VVDLRFSRRAAHQRPYSQFIVSAFVSNSWVVTTISFHLDTKAFSARAHLPCSGGRGCSDGHPSGAPLHRGFRSIFSPESVWINPLDARQRTNHKPLQLVSARKVGFPIPETLISNDPDEIRRFHRECRRNVVCKFFIPAFWENQAEGKVSASFTAPLTEDLLNDDTAFTSCPAIYQERLQKKADVRVTFFGSTYQAVRIWSQQSVLGLVDYRSDMRFESVMEPMEMDADFLARCMEFSSQMGLLHGSYDFVEQPDGSMVFVEINEMGQFLWLEERLPQLPMLSMFAAFSLEPHSGFCFDPARCPAHSFDEFIRSQVYAEFRQGLTAKGGIAWFRYLE
jgi:hypothetical protein